MPEAEANWLTAARANGYRSIDRLWRRAGLSGRALTKLAYADTFQIYGLNRRESLWQVKALPRGGPLPLFDGVGEGLPETLPDLAVYTEAREVYSDYVSQRLTLHKHPIEVMAEYLGQCVRTNALRDYTDGQPITVCGLVVCRQQPGTASGVVFLTLEDEVGTSNIIIWGQSVFPRFRAEVMAGRLLRISGKFQREGIVTNVIAEYIEDMSHLLDQMGEGSESIYPAHDNADHVRQPVQSSTSIARNQAASHVPGSRKPDPDPLGADPKTDRKHDRKDVTAYYAHGAARHPRSQAAKLFPSRDFH